MSNPFYNSIAFTFRGHFHFVSRNDSPLLFYSVLWLIQPYTLLKAGWHLSSPRAGNSTDEKTVSRGGAIERYAMRFSGSSGTLRTGKDVNRGILKK